MLKHSANTQLFRLSLSTRLARASLVVTGVLIFVFATGFSYDFVISIGLISIIYFLNLSQSTQLCITDNTLYKYSFLKLKRQRVDLSMLHSIKVNNYYPNGVLKHCTGIELEDERNNRVAFWINFDLVTWDKIDELLNMINSYRILHRTSCNNAANIYFASAQQNNIQTLQHTRSITHLIVFILNSILHTALLVVILVVS